MKKILLIACCLVSVSAWAGECNQSNGASYSKCIENSLKNSQNKLKSILNDEYSRLPERSKDDFKEAQKAWLKYREAQCNYQLGLNLTASDFATDSQVWESECIIELNNERIATIQKN